MWSVAVASYRRKINERKDEISGAQIYVVWVLTLQ